MDSNRGRLVLEVTAQPTVTQPLPSGHPSLLTNNGTKTPWYLSNF